MLEAHYAPRCEVRLAESAAAAEQIVAALRQEGMRVDVLDGGDDLVEFARTLYGELRRADERALDALVAVLPPARGMGHAIRDRLTKAATGSARAGRHGAGPSRAG